MAHLSLCLRADLAKNACAFQERPTKSPVKGDPAVERPLGATSGAGAKSGRSRVRRGQIAEVVGVKPVGMFAGVGEAIEDEGVLVEVFRVVAIKGMVVSGLAPEEKAEEEQVVAVDEVGGEERKCKE